MKLEGVQRDVELARNRGAAIVLGARIMLVELCIELSADNDLI